MSPAPRPYIHSPSIRAPYGSPLHSEAGSGLTTSMWPLRISERPSASPAGQPVREDVRLAGDVPAERGARRVALERRGVERHVERLEPEVGERAAHDGLAGRLVAEQRRRRDELRQQLGHRGRLGRDGRQDLLVHGRDPTGRGPGYDATAWISAGRFQHSVIWPSAKRTMAPPRASSAQPGPWLARHVKRVATRSFSETASSSVTAASGKRVGGRGVEAAEGVDVLDAGREAVQRRVGREQREVVLGVPGVERVDGLAQGGLVGRAAGRSCGWRWWASRPPGSCGPEVSAGRGAAGNRRGAETRPRGLDGRQSGP